MSYYAYIIKSDKTGGYYFGHCQDMVKRLARHNSGKVKSTKSKMPWRLHYYEEFTSKSESYIREQYFKSLEGRKWLYEKNILKLRE